MGACRIIRWLSLDFFKNRKQYKIPFFPFLFGIRYMNIFERSAKNIKALSIFTQLECKSPICVRAIDWFPRISRLILCEGPAIHCRCSFCICNEFSSKKKTDIKRNTKKKLPSLIIFKNEVFVTFFNIRLKELICKKKNRLFFSFFPFFVLHVFVAHNLVHVFLMRNSNKKSVKSVNENYIFRQRLFYGMI